jgi:hypothetical protein
VATSNEAKKALAARLITDGERVCRLQKLGFLIQPELALVAVAESVVHV